ncbi:MAG TPA: SpoIIE family protein phosphatase [Acidimicrobiia bacterium]|nr:SpoIIE family protein phosphatase [Acidimicrobiia bacterium]
MVSAARSVASPVRGSRRSRLWLAASLFAGAAVALIDILRHREVLLTGVLVAPLIAAVGASFVEVTIVGVYAIALAVLLGEVNDIFLSTDHLVRIGVVALASAAAVGLTRIREHRESELEIVLPQARDAQRLRLALAAGGMGTWRWNLVTGKVDWDEQLEALFGLAPGSFDGSMEMYRSCFHPDDRERAIATVSDGMARGVGWRFDHRVLWADGTVHWLEGRGEPVADASGTIVGATGISVDIDERRRLLDAEQASRRRLRTLLESSERLGALDDPDRVLETICDLAATRIGSWATIMRLAPDGSLERSNVAHREPELVPLLRELMETLSDDGASITSVLRTGQPLLFHGLTAAAAQAIDADPDLRANLERVGFQSCVLVPLTVAGRRLAVLSVGDEKAERLGPADVELAVDLGRRGASALEHARLWQESQQRFEAEHRIVGLLQTTIIPDRLPAIAGVQVAAAYRPAEVDVDVGGDWYDAFETNDGGIVVVVGDVAGHGVEAASLMGRVRNALRAYAFEDSDPASILLRLHRLIRNQDDDAMVTAFVARYDPESGFMSWSRAGHPPPLLVAPDGTTRFLDDVNGAPLGTMAREYRTSTTRLEPGALMVGYTDGLIERRDRILDDGLDWLEQRVRQHAGDPLGTLCDKLVDDPFVPHPSPDDICVVALRVEARPDEPARAAG